MSLKIKRVAAGCRIQSVGGLSVQWQMWDKNPAMCEAMVKRMAVNPELIDLVMHAAVQTSPLSGERWERFQGNCRMVLEQAGVKLAVLKPVPEAKAFLPLNRYADQQPVEPVKAPNKRFAVRVYDREAGRSSNDHLLCYYDGPSAEAAVEWARDNFNPQSGDAFYAEPALQEPEVSDFEYSMLRAIEKALASLDAATVGIGDDCLWGMVTRYHDDTWPKGTNAAWAARQMYDVIIKRDPWNKFVYDQSEEKAG